MRGYADVSICMQTSVVIEMQVGGHTDLHNRRMPGLCSPPYLRCAMRQRGRSNWLCVCRSEGHARDGTTAI